jgi:hypothetical protein
MKLRDQISRRARVLAILLCGVGGLAGAGSALGAEAWGTDTVKSVYPLANGSFVLTLNTSPPGCPSTSNPKYLYVVAGENGVTADGVKAMLAVALTAAAAGKQLSVAFDDSSPSCYVNRLALVN